MASKDSIHQFSIAGLTGGEVNFAQFAGKKLLVVNTASECGYTPQYQQLQELYTEFGDKLAVVGIPCNDFGGQEPGDGHTIAQFCERNFGVTFPLTEKLSTKSPQHPVFAWLTNKEQNGVLSDEIKWNFHKFLLDEQGRLLGSYPSAVDPASEEILQHLT